jgi:AcrR family transcriptional regulator
MPPHADPALEKRILDAAGKLWRKGGEKALTMRAVATAARTTTPTLYGRFRNKLEIMRALRIHIRQELYALLKETETPREACESYINFALSRPHEYRLLTESWALAHIMAEPTPSFDMMKERLARRFGGQPSEYHRLTLALWSMLHGMVTLAISGRADKSLQADMRQACMEALETLALTMPTGKRSNELAAGATD